MPGRHFLHVPGPTNVPDRILNAMRVPMEDHRSSVFPKLALPLFEDSKKLFKTKSGQVFIFPATGTGAWEAVMTNTLCSGDRVLASRYGQFSHLWIDLCQRHGLDVQISRRNGAPARRPSIFTTRSPPIPATRSAPSWSCRTKPRPV